MKRGMHVKANTGGEKRADLRLHQVVALAAYVLEEAQHLHRLLLLHLLQHAVDDDVGAGAAHPGAANASREGGVNSS